MPDHTTRSSSNAATRVPASTELGLGWSVEIHAAPRGATITLLHPQQAGIDVEIVLTADGPVIRTHAAALQLRALGELNARCESFTLEASTAIALRAPNVDITATEGLSATGKRVEVAATHGNVLLKANDDVQLLGEQILLNCERDVPLPAWLESAPPAPSGAPQNAGGDEELLKESARAP